MELSIQSVIVFVASPTSALSSMSLAQVPSYCIQYIIYGVCVQAVSL